MDTHDTCRFSAHSEDSVNMNFQWGMFAGSQRLLYKQHNKGLVFTVGTKESFRMRRHSDSWVKWYWKSGASAWASFLLGGRWFLGSLVDPSKDHSGWWQWDGEGWDPGCGLCCWVQRAHGLRCSYSKEKKKWGPKMTETKLPNLGL